jgi:hypothetical protein
MKNTLTDIILSPLGSWIAIMAIFVGITISALACDQSRSADDSNYINGLQEDMVTLSPRPGVECYIIRGHTPTDPRAMSCVKLGNGS